MCEIEKSESTGPLLLLLLLLLLRCLQQWRLLGIQMQIKQSRNRDLYPNQQFPPECRCKSLMYQSAASASPPPASHSVPWE
jgi:hypothetical protein